MNMREYVKHRELMEKMTELQEQLNLVYNLHVVNIRRSITMSKYEFVIGDVVRLKSGKVKMTVVHIESTSHPPDTHICCDWFEGTTPFYDGFKSDELELVEKEAND